MQARGIEMVKVTREFIMAARTERGAWRAAQLEIIGVAWPPEHGWIDRVCGNEISDQDAESFVLLAAKTSKRSCQGRLEL